MAGVPAGYRKLPNIDVFVENIVVRQVAPDLYWATFEQVETFPDIPHRRHTTGLLRLDDGQVKWLLFHLTLIDPSRVPAAAAEAQEG